MDQPLPDLRGQPAHVDLAGRGTVEWSCISGIELQCLLLLGAHAVDIDHNVVANDADLALLADTVGYRTQDGVPAHGTKRRPYGLGRERDQLASDHVAFRPEGFLDHAPVFEIADEAMRGRKWKGERGGDFGSRERLFLLGDEGQDGDSAIQRPIVGISGSSATTYSFSGDWRRENAEPYPLRCHAPPQAGNPYFQRRRF